MTIPDLIRPAPLPAPASASEPAAPPRPRVRIFGCRLCWRLALAVWVSIILVHALLLIPSVAHHRDLRLERLGQIGLAAVRAALPPLRLVEGEEIVRLGQMLQGQWAVRGGAMYDVGGRLIGRFGEPPSTRARDFGGRSGYMIALANGERQEVFWSAEEAELPFDLVLRLDSSYLRGELFGYVWRAAGIGLLTSFVTAGVVLFSVGRVVLLPLFNLRERLEAAHADAGHPERHQLPVRKADELGDVIGAFNVMLWRIAASLNELRRHEDALRQANEELERRVAERTSALTAANQSLQAEIAERRRAEARLEHLATHDPLTGLPNRMLFRDRLEQALALARREQQMVGVLWLDLDRFKEVNDELGHPAGDLLLRQVGARLLDAIRASDTVARLGGDEFAIVQVGLAQPGGSQALARRLLEALGTPFELGAHRARVGVSIGVAIAPPDGDAPDRLLKHADLALRQAKTAGRNTFRMFEPAPAVGLRRV